MTRHTLRSTVGTSFLFVVLALATVAVAADYPGAYFDMEGGGGAAVVQAPSWADLMGAIEACAARSDCAVTVAFGGQTFRWTAAGPLLALTDADTIAGEVDEPEAVTGGTNVMDVFFGVPSHKLTP